jgi:hypothetical protein
MAGPSVTPLFVILLIAASTLIQSRVLHRDLTLAQVLEGVADGEFQGQADNVNQ